MARTADPLTDLTESGTERLIMRTFLGDLVYILLIPLGALVVGALAVIALVA